MKESAHRETREGISSTDTRNRVTAALVACGLVIGALVIGRIGLLDAGGALSYLGRMTGFFMLAAAIVAALGAVAVVDFWGKRNNRISGPVVLLGILTVLSANLMLLGVQIQGGEFTPYLTLWLALTVWSIWALWVVLHKERVWSLISAPRSFAIGVFITGLVAVANFSYSQIYQPYAAPQLVASVARFGKPATGAGGYTSIPIHTEFKNEGKVAIYLIHASYSVTGRQAAVGSRPTSRADRLESLQGVDADLSRDVQEVTKTFLKAGRLVNEGTYLEPGESVSEERLLELPKGTPYDALELQVYAMVVRKDRLGLGFEDSEHSWLGAGKDKLQLPRWISAEYDLSRGTAYVHYQYKVKPSSAIIEFTRQPVNLNVWWIFGPSSPFIQSTLARSGRESIKPVPSDLETWSKRFGLAFITSGRTELPIGG